MASGNGKKRGHLRRRFKVAFAIAGKQASGIGEHAVMAQTGENIQDFALCRRSVGNAISGEQREMQVTRYFDGNLVAAFFLHRKMPLQLDVDSVTTKDSTELFDYFARGFSSAVAKRVGERPFVSAGEAD
jgi:hypothetical protein